MWVKPWNLLRKGNSFLSRREASKAARFDTEPFKLYKLQKGPDRKVTLVRNDGLKYYQLMVEARRFEELCGKMYTSRKIRGFCHLYLGQEACAVGIRSALRPSDCVTTSYRSHVWTNLMGVSWTKIMQELLGDVRGVARARGGSMHMYAPNFYGGNGIVGAQLPLGTGVALAQQYKKSGGVSVTLYGDGASNQGQVFESYNMAKLWNLPVIYVCENNGYGMGTSASRATAAKSFYTRGDYIPGIGVDGMDILAVREATRFALAYCLSGLGPIILELITYRYSGHSMSDPGTSYRTRKEVEEVRKLRDPIQIFKKKLKTSGLADNAALRSIDEKVKKEMKELAKISQNVIQPKLEELTEMIYVKPAQPYIRGIAPWNKHLSLGKSK